MIRMEGFFFLPSFETGLFICAIFFLQEKKRKRKERNERNEGKERKGKEGVDKGLAFFQING